jgi:hypothetical protein
LVESEKRSKVVENPEAGIEKEIRINDENCRGADERK